MDYVEGNSLADIIQKEKQDEFRVIGYILDILDALIKMHSVKPSPIIHGDIKPENIIISQNRAILIDFGSVSGTSGTSGFCAPENLAGFSPTVQSDIYSVGQVMHMCLTGKTRKLFESNKRGIKKGLYRIIEQALMKIPSDRYLSAMEMVNDLKSWTRTTGNVQNDNSSCILTSIPGNPYLACEIGSVLSYEKDTLLVDLDMLAPGIDMLMHVNKIKGSAYEYGFSTNLESGFGVIHSKKKGRPDILPCIASYDLYEQSHNGVIEKIYRKFRDLYDVIIICCNRFPYDSIFIESLFISDCIILTIGNGPVELREINTMALHLSKRQGINLNNIYMIAYGFSEKMIQNRISSASSQTNWLGSIPYSKQRNMNVMNGFAYLPVKNNRDYKTISTILKRTEVF